MEAQKKTEAEELLFSIYQQTPQSGCHRFPLLLGCESFCQNKFAAGQVKLYPLGTLNEIKDPKKANLLVENASRQYSLKPISHLKDFSEFLGLLSCFMAALTVT